ncbi:MAG: family 10 glycosylhydrolase [Akkermansiaceae bacterium]|nr:family 10 glycosylhydrolase [Akkermansiaceae bacterium]MCF7731439.1 family 10 glycosylhydrolase [Akkermansiaceae bacterium]
MVRLLSLISLLLHVAAGAQAYVPVNERPPGLAREFRGAWVASIYNIDWPSTKGLSAAAQQAELRTLLDKLAALKMNAVIFQVRPHCDALYASSTEPWSPWLTGTMGRSPGYDPLSYCIREAHARGIEVHAWFNPFRALANTSHPASADHITRAAPHLTKRYGTMVWCDPALPEARNRALGVILDVVRRYDVDGVHLDDYFYPYPTGGLAFKDGKSPAQRRSYIDGFVKSLYASVKKQKPWVRVGISPFGIWRPGVPAGIEASLDSYEQLACDAPKWLKNGWVDYLAPQLYWRISPQKQSFPALLTWWRSQGTRPVWPGIATSRINSSEDPGRPTSEITNQIALTRKIGKNWNGHLHWSAKSLVRNQGGIATRLAGSYTQPAAVPPMPWVSNRAPTAPGVSASRGAKGTTVSWVPDRTTAKIAVQARTGNSWRTIQIVPVSRKSITIPSADAIAVTALDRFGNASPPKVLGPR